MAQRKIGAKGMRGLPGGKRQSDWVAMRWLGQAFSCSDSRGLSRLLSGWLPVAAAMSFVLFAAIAQGQFQPPTDEELKMTAEPKAPGAAAIYLYREETVDDHLHFHTFFARIKVLTEKAKELATVEVPYPKGEFQITDIKGRTIHADGKVVPLDVKPADLLASRSPDGKIRINQMVFTLPSVEVGSILEYKWQLHYDDHLVSSPYWDVQQPYFIRKAHYSFEPYNGLVLDRKGNGGSRLLYMTILPNGVKVVQDMYGKFKLDITDEPAIPREEFMPPIESVTDKVIFYYSPYVDKDDFWKHEGGGWSKDMDHFAGESKALKDAVGHLVSASDSEEVKAKKLYDAVMALENTDYTRKKSQVELKQEGVKQIRDAEDVWNQKSGSRDEIALLYLAMARIAGLKAYALTVCNRNHELFNAYYLTTRQFDDLLVVVTVGGREIVVDPGEKFAAFGELGWRHTMAGGMRQSDKGTAFVETAANSYKEATTLRMADVKLAKDGSVTGTMRITMNGPAALHWRQVALENDEDEVRKRFNESLRNSMPDGVSAEFRNFLGLEDYHSELMAVAKLSGHLGTVTGKRVFLPSIFFSSRVNRAFAAEEKRVTPVDMEYADSEEDDVTYRLPEGFTIESAPSATKIPWPGHAVFSLNSTVASTSKDRIVVVRSMARAFTMVPPQEYPALRDFYQKVATADQQQLVLTMTPVTAGDSE